MKLRNRMLVIATVALAALCVSAVPAAAQAAFQGSFTLDHAVTWQGSTFPAGEYTFKMDSAARPNRILLKGPNGYGFVGSIVADNDKSSEESSLIIEHRGSTSIVRELYLAPLGMRLRYSVPKTPKEVELAQGPVTVERILVAMK
jgi:hypothetical protein